jgi:hypothetical protein
MLEMMGEILRLEMDWKRKGSSRVLKSSVLRWDFPVWQSVLSKWLNVLPASVEKNTIERTANAFAYNSHGPKRLADFKIYSN